MKRLARVRLPGSLRPHALKERARRSVPRGLGTAPTPGRRAGHPESDGLVAAVQHGSPLYDALVARTRAMLRSGDAAGAQSFAESLRAVAETEAVGRLLCGLVAYHRGFVALAWDRLSDLPPQTWARHAPQEFARAGLSTAPERALAAIRQLPDATTDLLPPGVYLTLVGPLLAIRETGAARELLTAAERAAATRAEGADVARRIEGLRAWAGADPDDNVAPRAAHPVFAVLDYRRPGALDGSKNIGDHVQSVAALAHLVRHVGVSYTGDPDLVDLLGQLRERVRPDLALTDTDATVEIICVQRDASSFQSVPEGTWTLCFGWYMHAIFGFRHDFPLNPGLRPLFVSFHCNERELLTEAVVEYMKRYGPVGCRDWTTVYLLRSMGVPAFFSGCLTTTINTLFPAAAPDGARDKVAYVDIPRGEVPTDAAVYGHALEEVRSRSFAANCLAAIERLETYRREYAKVVTSRLHAYLPVRSLGVPVDFRPGNPSDVRFDGLANISDAQFDLIRSDLLELLAPVVRLILDGGSEDDVYALWRELTASAVAEADRYAAETPDPSVDLGALADQLDTVRRATVSRPATSPLPASAGTDNTVHVGLELPAGGAPRLSTLLRSMSAHGSRPVHVWVLCDGDRPRLQQELAAAHPDIDFSWLVTTGLGEGLRTGTGQRPASLRRLLLGDLLPDVATLVWLPVGAVVDGDVAELAGLDLQGHLIAAPTVTNDRRRSGFRILHRAAARLRGNTRLAQQMLRNAYARHTFDFDAFGTDVMVLDLDRMRSTGFGQAAASVALAYGLNAREAWHYLCGPDRAVIPATWAWVPTQDPEGSAALTFWNRDAQPWDEDFAPGQHRWLAYTSTG